MPRSRPARPELLTERHDLDKALFTSSGRGGSGNIQPSASYVQAYPLTASILSQHSAIQAQYEKRVRNDHADSNLIVSHPIRPVHPRIVDGVMRSAHPVEAGPATYQIRDGGALHRSPRLRQKGISLRQRVGREIRASIRMGSRRHTIKINRVRARIEGALGSCDRSW